MALYERVIRRRGSGDFIKGRAGEVLGRCQVVYRGNDSVWYKADADAIATMPVVGITMESANTNQIFRVLLEGFIGAAVWTWTPGGMLYASTNAGEMTQTKPVPPDVPQNVGVAVTATMIYFDAVPVSEGIGPDCVLLEGDTAYVGFDACKGALYTNYFYCDGTADDVQINAALTYVSSLGGGNVFLEAGTYDITAVLTVASDNILIEGTGDSTILLQANATNLSRIILTRNHWTIRDLKIDGNSGNNASAEGIESSSRTDLLIENVLFEDIPEDSIDLAGCSRCFILNNRIINNGDDAGAIRLSTCTNSFIISNEIDGSGTRGIFVTRGSLDDSNIIVADNHVNNTTGVGINISNIRYATIIGNIVKDGTVGISLVTCERIDVIGNICYENSSTGILLEPASFVTVTGNNCYLNGGFGINIPDGGPATITSNVCSDNDLDGILVTDVSLVNVVGNTCNNNCQSPTGNWGVAGIHLYNEANTCVVSSNICYDDQGGSATQVDGIRLRDGTDTIIMLNQCIDNIGYGINVSTVGAVRAKVKDNKFSGNTTGAINDGGTDTIVHEKLVYVADPDSNVGDHPTLILPDTVDTTFRFQVPIPLEFQQTVTAQVIVLQTSTGGPPNMQWSTTTDWGKLCAGENYNAGSDAETDQTTTVAQNELVCVDVSASLIGIAAGDLVGFAFIRRATQAGDTINADAYYLGFRLRYV